MSTIKYLFDENVDPIYRTELLRRDPAIIAWRVGMVVGAPSMGTLDPEILCWCEENSFILVTNNRKSMPVHLIDHLALGRHMPGIFIINKKMSVGETIEELLLVWGASDEEEYRDLIIHLPIS